MKNLFITLFILLLSTIPAQAEPSLSRGMFVSVLQDPVVLSSREEIDKLVNYARRSGIKTLFVQIYRANQAWFPTQNADASPYQKALKSVGEDPLALLIRKAHKADIEVHAWVNLLSLSKNADAPMLKKYGPEILTRNVSPKKSLKDYEIDNQYFLEPGDMRVRSELAKIIVEILKAYPSLDGLQFDYIRYPDTKPAYGHTAINLERFRKASGLVKFKESDPLWQDWKRDQVTELLIHLANKAREVNPRIRLSTTGCMPHARAYHEAFQDWPKWVNEGIVEFVTLMNYSTDLKEYERWLTHAKTKVKDFNWIHIGFGAYKAETSPTIFQKQYEFCQKSGAGSCVIFHYANLLQNPTFYKYLLIKK